MHAGELPSERTPTGGPTVSDEAATARADAAAAKARAKALRPWYRKKRWWAAAAAALIISVGALGGDDEPSKVAAADTDTPEPVEQPAEPAPEPQPEPHTSSSNRDNPPQDDVTVTSCTVQYGTVVQAELEVTNHSSRRSSYPIIGVSVEDDQGVKVAEAVATLMSVDPGQTARTTAIGVVTGNPADVTCRVAQVERWAA